jgi:hypothetical protein
MILLMLLLQHGVRQFARACGAAQAYSDKWISCSPCMSAGGTGPAAAAYTETAAVLIAWLRRRLKLR